ncbi:hypothetical protein AVEN_51818-1 [Araneus ventricosus]|uniref:Uncharacterized protein n=1 Tax=Araneus ventricosus TaxID=182803 RepID=A0A4Y2H2U6_ARAVE|nr:hypothetical protein AVEN_51818-1 [Araneus ventricosus]
MAALNSLRLDGGTDLPTSFHKQSTTHGLCHQRSGEKSRLSDQTTFYHSCDAQCRCILVLPFFRLCSELKGTVVGHRLLNLILYEGYINL